MLNGKKILIGITGSIAAYKIPTLVRLLKKEGAEVQIIFTPFAREFVTPLTLSTLSERPVLSEFHDKESGEWNSHVNLGLWADLFLLAPLTANSLAKMANGIADNLLLTTYLSARCSVFFAPAMDLDMFQHTTTKKNIEILQSRGNILIQPTEGELASGLCGEGRMEEPGAILEIIRDHFKKKDHLKGKKVLVTAGPTYEAIDPVRFIGNYSSGLMGYALAREAAEAGAEVILVSGPVSLQAEHPSIYKISVVSAEEMHQACRNVYQDIDIAIMAAAVADYMPDQMAESKIKKGDKIPEITLKPTPDILSELGKTKRNHQTLIGFALETDNEIENAKKKLKNKNLDFIVLNSLKDKGAGFGTETNKITIIEKSGDQTDFGLKHKDQVARDIIQKAIEVYEAR